MTIRKPVNTGLFFYACNHFACIFISKNNTTRFGVLFIKQAGTKLSLFVARNRE